METRLLLVYDKVLSTSTPIAYNPVCKDGNIHIRLNTFDNKIVLQGFEKKLAFYIVGCLQKLVKQETMLLITELRTDPTYKKEVWDLVMAKFFKTEEYTNLVQLLKKRWDVRGLTLLPVYKRKQPKYVDNCQQFGIKTPDKFIDIFKSLTLDLTTYLFDDGYYLLIDKADNSSFNNYKKYVNKDIKQLKLHTKTIYKENSLW